MRMIRWARAPASLAASAYRFRHQYVDNCIRLCYSRRGKISAYARIDTGLQPGSLFMAFCYNEALDPYGKIPEVKFCAVRIAPGDKLSERIN